jgi:hypothetical protein
VAITSADWVVDLAARGLGANLHRADDHSQPPQTRVPRTSERRKPFDGRLSREGHTDGGVKPQQFWHESTVLGLAEGHVLRFDATGRIIGLTIINAKWLLDRDGELIVTLPEQAHVAPAALEAALAPA